MNFMNGTTLEMMADQPATLLIHAGSKFESILNCRTHVVGGRLRIDVLTRRPGEYVLDVPNNAIISQTMEDDAPFKGLAVMVGPQTQLGQFALNAIRTKFAQLN